MVYATRRIRRGETFTKRFTAKLFYRIIDFLSDISIPKNTGDFRLMDRTVVDSLSKLPERTRLFCEGAFPCKIYFAKVPFRAKFILRRCD